MKSVLLTALLAVLQASPQVPRQTINGPARTGSTVQHEAKADNEPPTRPQPTTNAQTASNHDAASKEQGTNNIEHSISVSKPPTATVSSPKRDWGYWAFNLLLVVVGVLQVILLRVTWKTIQRQVQLQEFNQQQWMDIGDWEVEEDKESSDPLT